MSLPARILRHSKLELLSFEEKLEHIFKEYGDDYGAAEQILDYMQKNRNATEEYNIQASKEQAGKDAQIRLNIFIENLELAQSYGQIEETKENKKEKIQKIANEWFAYADETKNYGFFKRILEEYEKKLHEDAKVRGEALLREVEGIENNDTLDECRKKRIAAGCGLQVMDVNRLLKGFEMLQQMTKSMAKGNFRGIPGMGGMPGMGGGRMRSFGRKKRFK